jgi:DNA-binding beta-propeller fold protein YncE
MNSRLRNLLACASLVLAAASSHAAEDLTLKQKIPLPGVEGRIDHFAVDAQHGRLFVCALGNNTLEVVDLDKGERIGSIPCPGAPQGVGYDPESNRLLVANDKGGICQLFDSTNLKKLAELNLKGDADNVRYDPTKHRFYVGYGSGGIAVVDARSGKLLSSLKVSGHPEAFILEAGGPRIFVNIPTAREVAVLDRSKEAVVGSWKTDWAFSNFPMAFDADHHRLFVGCRMPARLVVLDTDSGKPVAKLPIGGDTDDVFYDPRQRQLYVICGAGKVEVINQTDANTYSTADGARTGLFIPERNLLVVAVPHRGSQPAELLLFSVN